MPEITCKQCGRVRVIEASRVGRSVYCNRACKDAHKAVRQTRHCAYPLCGRTFTAKVSRDQKYCSPECFYDDISIPIRPLPMSSLERSRIEGIALKYDRLVGTIARNLYNQYMPRTLDLEDFEQEGRFGLLTAIQLDDDPNKSDRFPGFASKYIRYTIISAYREQEHTIRLPVSLFRPDAKVSSSDLEHFKRHADAASLDALPPEVRDLHHAGNFVETAVLQAEVKDRLYRALRALPQEQRTYIIEHFGLVGDPTAMLQLTHKYGIPRVSMWRTIHRGLDTLKASLTAQEESTR